LFVLFFCFVVEYYVVFYKIGVVNYAIASRASKSLLIGPYSRLSFYKMIIPLISIISLLLFFKEKNKHCIKIFIISFILALFDSLISMSRSELISLILPIFYLIEKDKVISKKVLIILVIGVFLLFGVWKSFKSNQMEIYYDSEFNTWYKISNNVLNYNSEKLFGKSYLDTVINMIISFTNSEPLSRWYLRKFEYSTLEKGGGRGFSGVLEAFINYGFIGNIIVFGFYGFLMKQVHLKVKQDNYF
ncbi:MAG: oligosaccharide repeat unit polymerase, partial [Candidatus Riflebacteria bacterium]|nr:oligosaccharide repeat unit polymerase [Candidatus Riflebacteria bacterium]